MSKQKQKKYSPASLHTLLLVLLFVVGFSLRVGFLNYGLPHVYHPDEERKAQDVVRIMEGKTSLISYNHPPLPKFLAAGATFFLEKTGVVVFNNREITAVLGLRVVSLLFDMGSIWALYLLARVFLGKYSAAMAAFLYAIFPLAVFASKDGMPDTGLSFFFLFTLWLQLQLLTKREWYWYVLNGLALSLAFATKYNAVFLLLSLLVSCFFSWWKGKSAWKSLLQGKRILLMGVGVITGFVIGFPFVFFRDAPRIVQSLLFEKAHQFENGHLGITISGTDFWYAYYFIKTLFPLGGILFVLAVVGGIGLFVKGFSKQNYVVLAAVAPFYFAIEFAYKVPVLASHYVLPLLGWYCICAMLFVQWSAVQLARRIRLTRKILIMTGFAAVSLFPLIMTWQLLWTLVPDTRERMYAWIQENVPENAQVLAEPTLFYYANLTDGKHFSLSTVNWNELSIGTDAYFKQKSTAYILTSNLQYDAYLENPTDVPVATDFYQSLFVKGTLLHEETPSFETMSIHNPTLRVYKVAGLPESN
ncbi:MAG: glycosyltransferase family 39 protein [bacterium]